MIEDALSFREKLLMDQANLRKAEEQNAADAYQSAVKRGMPPIKHVMEHLGLSRATATRRIRAAREKGLLNKNAHPEYGAKLVAVAERLNVEPEALRQAVLELADGDLRVQQRNTQ